MAEEEKVFEMVERCVADAVLALENGTPFIPFAKVLDTGGHIRDIACDTPEQTQCYETLLTRLRAEAKMGDIEAVALSARVNIPEHYHPDAPNGIRIHLEERAKADRKVSARLLYIPYELFGSENGGDLTVMLHKPLSIGMPMEIFS